MFDDYKIFFLFGKNYKHVTYIFDTCSKKVKEKYSSDQIIVFVGAEFFDIYMIASNGD